MFCWVKYGCFYISKKCSLLYLLSAPSPTAASPLPLTLADAVIQSQSSQTKSKWIKTTTENQNSKHVWIESHLFVNQLIHQFYKFLRIWFKSIINKWSEGQNGANNEVAASCVRPYVEKKGEIVAAEGDERRLFITHFFFRVYSLPYFFFEFIYYVTFFFKFIHYALFFFEFIHYPTFFFRVYLLRYFFFFEFIHYATFFPSLF